MRWRGATLQDIAAGAADAARSALAEIPRDWRRYMPAAGAAAGHVVVLLAVAAMIAPALGDFAAPRSLEVTLVAEERLEPEPEPEPAAPEPVAAAPIEPAAPTERRNRRREQTAAEATDTADDATTMDDFIVPPSQSDVPLGLRSLLETDPCAQVLERMRGDCDTRWAELAAEGALDYSPRLEELAKMYPGFVPPEPGKTPFGVPKAPEKLSRKPSLAGGRVLAPLGSIPSGVATAGGPASQTGRLPPPSALHADPAWELPPRWLGHD